MLRRKGTINIIDHHPPPNTRQFIFYVALLEIYYPFSFRYFKTKDPKPSMNFLNFMMFGSICIGRLSVTLLEPSCFDDSLVNLFVSLRSNLRSKHRSVDCGYFSSASEVHFPKRHFQQGRCISTQYYFSSRVVIYDQQSTLW